MTQPNSFTVTDAAGREWIQAGTYEVTGPGWHDVSMIVTEMGVEMFVDGVKLQARRVGDRP